MKFLPLLSLAIVSILSCFTQTYGEITLTYKTAEGPLKIEGVDDLRPYTLVDGEKRYLPQDGIFNIEASFEDLEQNAYFPVTLTRKKVFSSRSEEDFSLEKNINPKIETFCYVGTAHLDKQPGYDPHDPLASNYSSIWGDQIPEKPIFIFVWINPEHSIHRAELLIASKTELERSISRSVSFISEEKLYPAILLMRPDGTFLKIDDAFSSSPTWNEACLCLMNDDASRLSALLDRDESLLQNSVFSAKLIHIAAAYGSLECMDLLLESGADPNTKMNSELRAIHLAARTGESEVIRSLLESGADIRAKDIRTNTALHIAASFGHLDVCKVLLEAGIKVDHRNEYRETAILLAGKNDQLSVIKLLSENGADFDFSRESRQILLLRAIKRNELDTVEFLLSKKARANRPVYAQYPISSAAQYASGAIIRLLIKNGADPNQKNHKGATPLMLASASNYDGVIALVENGAEINASQNGITALHIAILKHQIEITQYLLDHGANPNVKNSDGTPLMWLATEVGNRIGLNALIDAGAVCEMDRSTALPIMEYAFRYNIPEIVDITLSQCLEPDFMFRDVFPSYWVADRYGSQTIKDLLIQKGVDPSTVEEPTFADARLVRDQIRLIQKQDVVYPHELQEKYGEFAVRVEGIVDTDGSFIFPRLLENPVPEMERSILETFTHWKFKPLQLNEQPVRVRLIIPMTYVPTPQKEQVYEIEAVPIRPEPIKQIAPTYPPALRKAKVKGIVVLLFVVDENGDVVAPQVEQATHREFVYPALQAISRWKFSPGYYDGEPVKVRVRLPIQFNLN